MKDARLYVIQMLERSERIVAYTRGGRAEFFADAKTQDAVVRSFEVLGEAAKRVPEAVRALAPDIPWRQVAGFRDVLIHDYEGVDLEQVWKTSGRGSAPLTGPSQAAPAAPRERLLVHPSPQLDHQRLHREPEVGVPNGSFALSPSVPLHLQRRQLREELELGRLHLLAEGGEVLGEEAVEVGEGGAEGGLGLV